MKLYNNNKNFYELVKNVTQNGKVVHGGYNDNNSQFYNDIYELDGKIYTITEDIDNGITYSIEFDGD